MTLPSLFYREIQLSQGKVALVSTQDHEWLIRWKWSLYTSPKGKPYAARKENIGVNRYRTVYMARQIMGFPECLVDHIDPDDTLNNTRENLRLATRGENKINVKFRSDNTSGYKGVFWHKGANKWMAMIGARGKQVYLGLFADPVIASAAYDAAAVKHWGEFARTNPEC